MAVADVKYCYDDSVFRKMLYSPIKKLGFVPEKGSEIFVTGIPIWSSVYDLARFFEQAGELFQVRLLTEPRTINNRGYAFVTYMNSKLAEKALADLQQKPFIGIHCLSLQKSANNCRIFVGGLPLDKTKDQIWQELMSTYNIQNIVDVITYRNYSNPAYNRGFVFLEFRTHEEASYFRAKYSGKLFLFGKLLLVDWSVPVLDTAEGVMAQVKIIFLRNLDVTLCSEDFARQMYKLIDRNVIEKVYKFKNYAYVHLNSRPNAEKLLNTLTRIYKGTEVEVSWAKPPNRFSERSFRDKTLLRRKFGSAEIPVSSTQLSNPLRNELPPLSLSENAEKNLLLRSIRPASAQPTSSCSMPGTRQADLYSPNNVFFNTNCVSCLRYSFSNQSQPSPTGNFVVPILPQNLTPFHQIQPSYSSQAFQMPSPRPLSSFDNSSTITSGSNFSMYATRPTATSTNTEIRLQDMEVRDKK